MARRSPGEGSVTQREDGRWQAGLQIDGVRRTVYGKTRVECYQKLSALRKSAQSGMMPNPGTRTLDDLLHHWLETATPTLKPRTLADYQQTYRLYIAPTLGKTRLSRLTPDAIQRLYAGLQTRGLQRAVAKTHAVLHRALKLAVLWGWLAENPAERVLRPQYHAERKEVWSPWELNVFLTQARGNWLYPLWFLGIVTGCRPGELLALTWDDVDLDASSIHIGKALQRIEGEWVTTAPKTRSGIRTIALPLEGTEALRLQERQQAQWRAETGRDWKSWGLAFTQWDGTPLHGATASHGLRRECRRLGITEVTPHGLRHLHASLLLREGLPVPTVGARLGHAHPGITLAVYSHVVGNQDKAAVGAIERAIRAVGGP